MNTLTTRLACRPVHPPVPARRCVPRLLARWDYAEITPPPPVPENPTPSAPEISDPHGPVSVPPPMEHPIPVRDPPTTRPTQL